MINTIIKQLIADGVIEEPMDGNHGEIHPTSKDYVSSGIPFIMASDVDNGVVNYNTCKYISLETANGLRKGFTKEGDVLLTHKATIGRTAIIDNLSTDFAVLTPQVTYYRILKEDVLDRYYLKYFFDSPQFQYILKKRAGAGSTRAYIGIQQQQELPISFPDIKLQKKIGSVLSVLDKKIKNNNEINAKLEAMARTIYDYWFLQFDFPDENGKPYKSSGGKMVWNEELKREIPEGWDNGSIADLGEIIAGGTPSTSNPEYYCEKGIAWITPNDLSNTTDKYISHGERDITQLGLDNSSAKLMPKGTVLLTSRAPIGYIGIAINDVCTNQGFKSIVPYEKYASEYVYYTVLNMVPYIKSLGTGSTFTEVSKDVVSKVKIAIALDEIIEKFNRIMHAIGKKRMQAEQENKKLASLRDFLLPLLMNGQVGFKN